NPNTAANAALATQAAQAAAGTPRFDITAYTFAEGTDPNTPFQTSGRDIVINRIGDTSVAATLTLKLLPGTDPNIPSATAGTDFDNTDITVSFAAGETSKTVQIGIAPDSSQESDEIFNLSLVDSNGVELTTATVTITNDDTNSVPAPSLALTATDAVKAEGNSSNTAFTFTVTRTGDTTVTTTVNWAVTVTGTNPADNTDFGGTLPSGTATFNAGDISKTITVNVAGDTTFEPDEGFTVTLSNASTGATITTATATGTINNDDAPVLVVTNTNDSGPGSLRQAILDANAQPGTTPIEITFNIPGTGVQTINLQSALPAITRPVTINGYSQPGATENTLTEGTNAQLLIEINGASAGNTQGLNLDTGSNGSVIRGLVINGFQRDGIRISNSGNHVIAGNFIGTNAAGDTASANTATGVFVLGAGNNVIGGSNLADRNLISGNSGGGLIIQNGNGNNIRGNLIGTNAAGNAALANGKTGIVTFSDNNIIGGSGANEGNLLSGNIDLGIDIQGNSNTIQGNKVGTNAAGTSALGNRGGGIAVFSDNHNIGGSGVNEGNLISGNAQQGILIQGNSNNIQGNKIGTNAAGDAAIANSGNGILAGSGTGNTIENNLISGSGNSGIQTNAGGFTIRGNQIGTNLAGTGFIANANAGVSLAGSGSIVEDNTIAGNTADGVNVRDGGTGNRISQNRIFENGDLGIDLGNNGVTVNDNGDGDTGANNLQNFPVLNSVTFNSNTNTYTVTGTLNSTPSTQFNLEFFASATADASGNGEGQAFVSAQTVTTDASGNATFSVQVPAAGLVGNKFTATATNVATGDTSEFSQIAPVNLALTATDAVKAEGNSGNTAFTFTVARTGDTIGTTTANWAVTVTGTNPADNTDFGGTLPTGTVTFNAGEISKTITVNVAGDTTVEPDEGFTVTLSNPSTGATITTATATGTIQNDDALPTASISAAPATVAEDGATNLGFVVSLDRPSVFDTVVTYTLSGTATEGTDYAAITTKTITIAAGKTQETITVDPTADTVFENDETVIVTLTGGTSNNQPITIGTAIATGTINNDDVVPQISVTAGSPVVEDNGPGRLVFTLTIDKASAFDTFVTYTLTGTATEGTDYAAIATKRGTIQAGDLTTTVEIDPITDSIFEDDETVILTITDAET
ncbi:right-handed parallel beta-helix repeat-containing protein, partial [Synechocystis salina LEGE 06155]|nr:right-handed parallel beta-helix repeat-containing protein [Synechocystis salina LEGE 06155]